MTSQCAIINNVVSIIRKNTINTYFVHYWKCFTYINTFTPCKSNLMQCFQLTSSCIQNLTTAYCFLITSPSSKPPLSVALDYGCNLPAADLATL